MSTTIFSEYSSACLAEQLGLALGALDAALGLGARARGDLVGRLVGALEDAGGLLADLRERPLDDGLLRLPALELADELGDLLHEGVHRRAVVAAHHHRESCARRSRSAAPRVKRAARNSAVSKSAMGRISPPNEPLTTYGLRQGGIAQYGEREAPLV